MAKTDTGFTTVNLQRVVRIWLLLPETRRQSRP